jgi:hypothetical protein
MRGWLRRNVFAACSVYTVIVLWVLVPTSGESFRSTTGVYSRPSQLFRTGALPEPATGSHVVNRGTPVAPLDRRS